MHYCSNIALLWLHSGNPFTHGFICCCCDLYHIMAEALVVGALLSGFANVVLDRLISSEFVNLVVSKKLDRKLVERLKTALLAAKALAGDAEQKQFGNELVREWLHSLRDALYTADDLLDRVLIKAEIRSKVRTRLPSLINLSDRKMATKIEEVVKRIEDLQKLKDTLGLKEIPTGSSSWRPPSTSLERGIVYGRDDDKQALIKMLNDNNHHNLSVIYIVGMGGVGKTTLAQCLYNNTDLMKGFDLKAWICVSENFDIVETTKNLIKEITSGVCCLDGFNLLQQDLKEKLSEKKFFVVLDDIWSNDGDKWKSFITPFQHGRKGSTVLLTTRKENVAPIVQNYNSYFLNGLSDDYCWSIFADNSSFPESNGSSELEEIGKMIVKKCDGLPLAAETLGRLLRSKHDVEEWNKILSSDIWEFPVTDSKILPALLISYYHLPAYLKRCFVYCSLYPKDHKFDKDELILLWMAEDLLRAPKRRETLEEVGHECFDDLASRLFFKQLEYSEKYFVMHDLMHDLATFLAGEFYCRLSEELGEKEEMRILTRHLSCDYPIFEKLCSSKSIESLRTFLFINNAQFHVRMLRYCSRLRMLPNGMYNLVNLRHLDIWGTHLKEMPKGMSKLNQLHILSNYIVGKNEDSGIQELGGLPNLHGSFGIQKLENVIYVNQARSAKIRDKKHIDELWLEWSSGDDMVSDTQTERDILDNLQPHNGLKELTIWGYRGKTFPNWAGHCSYQNMTSVSLESCNNCYLLPSLGQLSSLQSLRIDDFGKLKSVGMEFYKNEGYQHSSPIALFPSLQLLEFDNMPCWEEWCLPDSEAFPQLKRLQINDCPMLKGGMLNSVLMRIVSSSLDVLKVSKLEIQEGHQGWGKEMTLDGDSLSFSECESVLEYAMVINHLTSLQEIHISGCLSAISFPGNCLPKSLQKLTILNCSNLEFPQQQQQKYDLVELRIEHSCDSLTSLLLDAFPNLKNLEIRGCSNLESVSMLVASPGEGLAAPNLTHLDVSWCSKLEALPLDMNSLLSSLQSLDIRACPNICRLPEGGLLPKLRSLTVGGCEQQLRSLSWMSNLDTLTHLTIDGSNCESIKSFQEVGSLPQLNTVSLSLSKSGNIGVQRASLPHFPPTITYFIL
ncbi:putative disease resistance protein At3g14460 isoform X2 [Arachis ipaensis]|uniref:putative disease resistance protein At3g14460 isoform X2 n=1 Tax=Arachis ipaensis TaxID=130454 RepID=UPI000A2B3B72|nr:putative disease resistance protein At3g14460 isoform X2 [Arachis ipaensis]